VEVAELVGSKAMRLVYLSQDLAGFLPIALGRGQNRVIPGQSPEESLFPSFRRAPP